MDKSNKNVAVLIDSENISSERIDLVMKESVRFGTLTIKRIYGDWSDSHSSGWRKVLPNYAISPIQQFKNTVGKNAIDSALIIDAMDILYTKQVDVFVIVSSDSDYTRLAGRLQESNKRVIGIGEKKAPSSLQKSCNEYIFIESLLERDQQIEKESEQQIARQKKVLTKKRNNSQATQQTVKTQTDNVADSSSDKSENSTQPNCHDEDKRRLMKQLLEAFNLIDSESEWKNLSKLSNKLRELDSTFSPRNYGFTQLSKMIVQWFPKTFDIRKEERGVFIRRHKAKRKTKSNK